MVISFTPAPSLPPPSPEKDPNKDKKQKQNSEQAKKKDRPVPPPGENKFFEKEGQQKHQWGKRNNHVEKTPENEKMIYDMANDPNCYYGPDTRGNHCYAKKLEDGRQVWTTVRNNKIREWGVNDTDKIRTYNSETGFKALKTPSQKTSKPPSER